MKIIDNFKNEYFFLSNFSPWIFRDEEGIIWRTNEHYFQAHKTNKQDPMYFMIKEATTPYDAKKYGRQVKLPKNWVDIKKKVMYNGLKFKFDQNFPIQWRLVKTGNALLIEGNMHCDNIWGDCKCKTCKGIIGQNLLGELLMDLRNEYKEKIW